MPTPPTRRRPRARHAALGAAASALLCAALVDPAFADEAVPIAVVTIQTEESFDQAEALTAALKTELRRAEGWGLKDGDWVLEVLTVALDCPEKPDALCEARIGDQISADRYVWGTMRPAGKDVEATLYLWERGKGSRSATVRYSTNLTEAADSSLAEIARGAIQELTGGLPNGSVRVRLATLDGEVWLGDQVVGQLRGGVADFELPAGTHTVVVRALGTADIETVVEVKPLKSVEIILVPREESAGVDWQKVAGFSAVGAGAIFATIGVFSSVKVLTLGSESVGQDVTFDQVRDRIPRGQSLCQDPTLAEQHGGDPGRVTQLCSNADTFQTMQMVFYPLAAVSAGVGIALLATADWGDSKTEARTQPGWDVTPRIGPMGGDLSVSVRF